MYKYDVAISYETQSESKVQEIVDLLRMEKWKIFFAPYCQKEMISQNLKGKLIQIYQNESLLKVLFITEEYLKRENTQLEMRSSLRSALDQEGRLIIVNYIGDRLPENLKKYVYVDGNRNADEIFDPISSRLKELKADTDSAEEKQQSAVSNGANVKIVGTNYGILGENVNIGQVSFGSGKVEH